MESLHGHKTSNISSSTQVNTLLWPYKFYGKSLQSTEACYNNETNNWIKQYKVRMSTCHDSCLLTATTKFDSVLLIPLNVILRPLHYRSQLLIWVVQAMTSKLSQWRNCWFGCSARHDKTSHREKGKIWNSQYLVAGPTRRLSTNVSDWLLVKAISSNRLYDIWVVKLMNKPTTGTMLNMQSTQLLAFRHLVLGKKQHSHYTNLKGAVPLVALGAPFQWVPFCYYSLVLLDMPFLNGNLLLPRKSAVAKWLVPVEGTSKQLRSNMSDPPGSQLKVEWSVALQQMLSPLTSNLMALLWPRDSCQFCTVPLWQCRIYCRYY